jgi:hypothetical protein
MTGRRYDGGEGSAKRTPATPRRAVAPPHAEFSPAANSGLDASCYERSTTQDSGGKMPSAERMVELDVDVEDVWRSFD